MDLSIHAADIFMCSVIKAVNYLNTLYVLNACFPASMKNAFLIVCCTTLASQDCFLG